MKTKVCIFEDDDMNRVILADIVIMLGYKVRVFSCPCEIGNEFNLKTIRNQADIVITDIRMPKMTGIELTSLLINSSFNPQNIAIISGMWTEEDFEFARRFRIQTFTKPISASTLMEWLQTRKPDRYISAQR